ncbi:hypothetical protein BC629DRAFT_1443224 [Irpex lacteus]|nr:hypothetical protein BC629DRAFT_1443224 [Irpex lacteus]
MPAAMAKFGKFGREYEEEGLHSEGQSHVAAEVSLVKSVTDDSSGGNLNMGSEFACEAAEFADSKKYMAGEVCDQCDGDRILTRSCFWPEDGANDTSCCCCSVAKIACTINNAPAYAMIGGRRRVRLTDPEHCLTALIEDSAESSEADPLEYEDDVRTRILTAFADNTALLERVERTLRVVHRHIRLRRRGWEDVPFDPAPGENEGQSECMRRAGGDNSQQSTRRPAAQIVEAAKPTDSGDGDFDEEANWKIQLLFAFVENTHRLSKLRRALAKVADEASGWRVDWGRDEIPLREKPSDEVEEESEEWE